MYFDFKFLAKQLLGCLVGSLGGRFEVVLIGYLTFVSKSTSVLSFMLVSPCAQFRLKIALSPLTKRSSYGPCRK